MVTLYLLFFITVCLELTQQLLQCYRQYRTKSMRVLLLLTLISVEARGSHLAFFTTVSPPDPPER